MSGNNSRDVLTDSRRLSEVEESELLDDGDEKSLTVMKSTLTDTAPAKKYPPRYPNVEEEEQDEDEEEEDGGEEEEDEEVDRTTGNYPKDETYTKTIVNGDGDVDEEKSNGGMDMSRSQQEQQRKEEVEEEEEEEEDEEEEELSEDTIMKEIMESLTAVDGKFKSASLQYSLDETHFKEKKMLAESLATTLPPIIKRNAHLLKDPRNKQKLMSELKDALLMSSLIKGKIIEESMKVAESQHKKAEQQSNDALSKMSLQMEKMKAENERLTNELEQTLQSSSQGMNASSQKTKDISKVIGESQLSTKRESEESGKSSPRQRYDFWNPKDEISSESFLYFSQNFSANPSPAPSPGRPSQITKLKPLKNTKTSSLVSAALSTQQSSSSQSSHHSIKSNSMQKSVTRQVYKTAMANRELFMQVITEETAASAVARKAQKKQSAIEQTNNSGFREYFNTIPVQQPLPPQKDFRIKNPTNNSLLFDRPDFSPLKKQQQHPQE